MPLATKRVSASCIMQTRHNNHSATIEQEKTMAERYPSPVRGTAQYCSRTFPRWTRARSRQGAKPRMIPRNLSRSTQVSHTPFSPASSPCAPEVPVLTRSKSLPDLREDLPRTNRSVLQKWEESDVAKHRSTLGWEISELHQEWFDLRKLHHNPDCSYTIDSRSTPLQVAQKEGKWKFSNEGPKEGLKYLMNKCLLNDTPEDVALFLHKESLDKKVVAQYLGKRHSFNRAVLACYVQLQDVRGVPLVESIRTFARSVTLMDSPCWVKSVMDEFARHYHTSNPRSFDSAETCGAAAFSVVMLSHNLHSDAFKEKVTLEQFAWMGRNAACLSFDTLQKFYESVLEQPIQESHKKSKREVVISGPLCKEDTKGNWSDRSFVLYSDSVLQYCKEGEEKDGKKLLLTGVTVSRCSSNTGSKKQSDQFVFELKSSSEHGLQIFKISGSKPDTGVRQTLRLSTKSESGRDSWIAKLEESIGKLKEKDKSVQLPSCEQGDC